jgi:hypothetical protein
MADHLKVGRNHIAMSASWTLDTVSTDRLGINSGYGSLSDCFLVNLGDGVVEYPEGDDEGILTKLVLHARTHNHWSIKLSELEEYIRKYDLDRRHGFVFPVINSDEVKVADVASFKRLFPDHVDVNPEDAESDYIRKWWEHGGYTHD